MSYSKRLTAVELYGSLAISYLWFSSSPQEKGSTIERQQEVLGAIMSLYRLVLIKP
jgi:hypothetical protein